MTAPAPLRAVSLKDDLARARSDWPTIARRDDHSRLCERSSKAVHG